MLKKYLFFIFFGILSCLHCFSMTIALACFQNKNAHVLSQNVTGKFEDLLFEPFFDSGFIVTNIPAGEFSTVEDIRLGKIRELFEEPADYIVVCSFEYGEDLVIDKRTERKVPDWKTLRISLIDFDGKKEIYTNHIDVSKLKGMSPDKKAEKLSGQVAKDVLFAIERDKKGINP